MKQIIGNYTKLLSEVLHYPEMNLVINLGEAIEKTWATGNSIFICGNGGSAGNANHIANDLIFGAGRGMGKGFKVESLSANPAVITCLANDIGYEYIYSEQLKVKANYGDLLLVLSGSGNSQNIINALKVGNSLGMETFAILGYDGGKCKSEAKFPIHFPVNDMQVSEDLQLICCHICMQWLSKKEKI
jgi:D-sedoheptulose 7-phosphate isomerase